MPLKLRGWCSYFGFSLFACTHEPGRAASIIKTVTGGPDSKVTCRPLYGEPFSYTPQYKPWFTSNYEPVIKGSD